MIKVATINILFKMELWDKRQDLLVSGLQATNADIIALQEVNILGNTGDRLAEKLGMPYVYQVNCYESPYTGGPAYGIAILSRYPFIKQASLDLKTQGRVAQLVQVEINNQPVIICNGHYYWQPGSCQARMEQFQLLVNWLSELSPELPIIMVGDFNATPDTPEITFLRHHFTSAYAQFHGAEPEYTCPTPLARANRKLWRKMALGMINAVVHRSIKSWRGTLDYVFFNQHLQVNHCELILTEPAPENPLLYPSDHFGIAADFDFV
ncbi:endonuclease/exonuclease/phosphatase [Calothrix sp. 336/3]|nr:endonuclease/exonuclease/phosphatase [Calothrix sp. 336/3]